MYYLPGQKQTNHSLIRSSFHIISNGKWISAEQDNIIKRSGSCSIPLDMNEPTQARVVGSFFEISSTNFWIIKISISWDREKFSIVNQIVYESRIIVFRGVFTICGSHEVLFFTWISFSRGLIFSAQAACSKHSMVGCEQYLLRQVVKKEKE